MSGTLRIDHEHEMLTGIIERLESTCAIVSQAGCSGCPLTLREKCAADVWLVMNTLAAYMHDHFKYEERQMDDCVADDQFIEHRNEHRKIAAQVQAAMDSHGREGLDPGAAAKILAASLSEWLRDHVEEQDSILAIYIGNADGSDDESLD